MTKANKIKICRMLMNGKDIENIMLKVWNGGRDSCMDFYDVRDRIEKDVYIALRWGFNHPYDIMPEIIRSFDDYQKKYFPKKYAREKCTCTPWDKRFVGKRIRKISCPRHGLLKLPKYKEKK